MYDLIYALIKLRNKKYNREIEDEYFEKVPICKYGNCESNFIFSSENSGITLTITGTGSPITLFGSNFLSASSNVSSSSNSYKSILEYIKSRPFKVNKIKIIDQNNCGILNGTMKIGYKSITGSNKEFSANLSRYVSPKNYRRDIVDIDADLIIDGNTYITLPPTTNGCKYIIYFIGK